MTQRDEVDDALDLAIKRTEAAQDEVQRAVEERRVPPEPIVRKVVQRADDLEELARDAADTTAVAPEVRRD